MAFAAFGRPRVQRNKADPSARLGMTEKERWRDEAAVATARGLGLGRFLGRGFGGGWGPVIKDLLRAAVASPHDFAFRVLGLGPNFQRVALHSLCLEVVGDLILQLVT